MAELRSQLLAGIPAGVVATVVMDAAMTAASWVGGDAFSAERLDPAVIGRWGGGLLRGHWRHADASREKQGALDVPLGIVTHYTTGIVLTEAFVLVDSRRRRPSFVAAVCYGISTAVFPLLVLFPSLGYGALGLRSGEPAKLARIMLVGHTAFGAGIGLGVALLVRRQR